MGSGSVWFRLWKSTVLCWGPMWTWWTMDLDLGTSWQHTAVCRQIEGCELLNVWGDYEQKRMLIIKSFIYTAPHVLNQTTHFSFLFSIFWWSAHIWTFSYLTSLVSRLFLVSFHSCESLWMKTSDTWLKVKRKSFIQSCILKTDCYCWFCLKHWV